MIVRLGRSIARRLIPGSVREPLGHRAHFLFAWPIHTAIRLLRALLPGDSNVFRRLAGRGWHGLSRHRSLLSYPPESLGSIKRARRDALEAILALPDPWYRRVLNRLDRRLPAVRAATPQREGRGIAMMIGALGPGGAERQVAVTLSGLAARGIGPLSIRCSFLRNDTERFFVPHLEPAGVSVAELEPASMGPITDAACLLARTLPSSLREVERYLLTLQKLEPSIVHLWLDEVNVRGGIAAILAGVPRIVLGMRSLPPTHFAFHQPYMREGYRWLAGRPEVTLVNNSAAGARAYEQWLGLAMGSIRVLHNGFDFDPLVIERSRTSRNDFRERHGIPVDAPVLGTVIRLSEEKRPMLWLEIAARVRARIPQVRFLLVGDGPMRASIEARVSQHDLSGAVVMTGHHRHPLATIAAMDLFLLTSRAEGLPNVLIEAQAMAVPVVTMKVGGAPETLVNRGTGWLLDNDDPEEAARLISRLIGDHQWCASARAAAPAFVRKAFGIERMLDETMTVYALQDGT